MVRAHELAKIGIFPQKNSVWLSAWMTSTGAIPLPYRNTPYSNPKWVLFLDPDSSEQYFFNTESGDTSWEDPEPPAEGEEFSDYDSIKKSVKESLHAGAIDAEDVEENIERNYYLKNVIETEIDRGVPPYSTEVWRTRPARKQGERDNTKFAYKEGSENYNMWYHKFTGDRFDATVREASSTMCDPWVDSGWTEADRRKAEDASFCIWFAKGCCTRGAGCKYKHRVPTREDDVKNDHMLDIFGRQRHASHKNDMGGVGSYMKDCRGLYIADIKIDRTQPDCIQLLEAQLWKLFHPWGPIESIRVIPNKIIAFVKYEHRSAAEFAKVACSDQPVGLSEAINVRWAFEDPNPRAMEQGEIDTRDQFFALIEQRIAKMSLAERQQAGLLQAGDFSTDLEERFEISRDREDS